MNESKIVPFKDAVLSLNLYCEDRKVGNLCFKKSNNHVSFTTDTLKGHFYDPGFPKECFNGDPVSFFMGDHETINLTLYNEKEEEIGHVMFVSKEETLRRVAIFCTEKFPYDLCGFMIGVDHVEETSKLPLPVDLINDYVVKLFYENEPVATLKSCLYTSFALTFEDEPSLFYLPLNMIPDVSAETVENLFAKNEGALRAYYKKGEHHFTESYCGSWKITDVKDGKCIHLEFKVDGKKISKEMLFDNFKAYMIV